MSFAHDMAAALPDGMHLPDAFARTFDWLEAQGWRGVFTNGSADDFASHFLSIYPPEERDTYGASYVLFSFEAGPPVHAPPPEVTARMATIAKIAGDGGTLSLWLDESDAQQFVVFNHGEPHVLTADPLVALQFLALGYPEPGALENPAQTPLEAAFGDDIFPAHALRTFVEDTFNVTLPERAADLGITIPPGGTSEPVRDWLDATLPPPDLSLVPGMTAENPYIITPELRDILGEDGLADLRSVYKYMIEEE